MGLLNALQSGMPYSFDWAVKDEESNNDYGQQEESDGRVVSGSYRVLMADGRTQVVTYRVEGDSGFVAKVTYEGEANTQSAGGSRGSSGSSALSSNGGSVSANQNSFSSSSTNGVSASAFVQTNSGRWESAQLI